MKLSLLGLSLLNIAAAHSQNIIIDSAWNSGYAVGVAHNSHPCIVKSTCTDEVRHVVHWYERELLSLFAASPGCSGVSVMMRGATNEPEVVRGSEWWDLMLVISDVHEKTHWALFRNTRGLDGKAIAPTVESDGDGTKKEEIVNRVCAITKYIGAAYPVPGSADKAGAGVARSSPKYPSAMDRGTERVHIFNDQLTPHLKAGIEQNNGNNEAALTMWTQVLAWLTGVLALIAAVQAYLFIRQLKVTQQALRDSKEAADAAKASADALPKIERAYIFAEVTLNKPFDLISEKYDSQVKIRFTNHGKTPAILTKLRAYTDYRKDLPKELILNEGGQLDIPKGIVVGAGKTYEIFIDVSLETERYKEILDVVWKVYCLGCIEYEDVLMVKRTTRFCWHSYPHNSQVLFSISPVEELNNYT